MQHKLLINLLSSHSRGEVGDEHKGYAVGALNNLAHDPAARTAITESSGVEIMMPQLTNMAHSWLKTQIIEFMQNQWFPSKVIGFEQAKKEYVVSGEYEERMSPSRKDAFQERDFVPKCFALDP